MTDAKLVALGKRINAALDRVEEEREAVKEIFAEAKSHGYIPKMLRKAITRMRMDASKRQEEDSILDLYDHALGNVGDALEAISKGATWEEAGKEHNVPRATLARAAAVSKRREVIPEITEQNAAPQAFAAGASPDLLGEPLVSLPSAPQVSASKSSSGLTKPAPEGGEGTGTHSDTPVLAVPASMAVGDVSAGHSPAPAAVITPEGERDERDDRLGREADASRPEGAPRRLEREGHVACAADAGREQQDDAAICLYEDSGQQSDPVAVQPDGPSGDGLGSRGVDPADDWDSIADAGGQFQAAIKSHRRAA